MQGLSSAVSQITTNTHFVVRNCYRALLTIALIPISTLFSDFIFNFLKNMVQTILQDSVPHYSRIKPLWKGTERIHRMLIQVYCRPFA